MRCTLSLCTARGVLLGLAMGLAGYGDDYGDGCDFPGYSHEGHRSLHCQPGDYSLLHLAGLCPSAPGCPALMLCLSTSLKRTRSLVYKLEPALYM